MKQAITQTSDYAEIVVVTRAPKTTGNMATTLGLFIEVEQPSESNDWQGKVEPFMKWLSEFSPELATHMLFKLRSQVFGVGEILFLDSIGREVTGAGRKPNKWDVDVQTVGTLEEAIALSKKVTDAEFERYMQSHERN